MVEWERLEGVLPLLKPLKPSADDASTPNRNDGVHAPNTGYGNSFFIQQWHAKGPFGVYRLNIEEIEAAINMEPEGISGR